MKIGIIRETKIPVDNRVALTPEQIRQLSEKYPNVTFKVQPSPIRAYSDSEYEAQGITVCEDLNDCDLLLGIKEALPETLIKNKHYIFFGHIAKKQVYNQPLFKKLIAGRNTFSDYEYIVNDKGNRLVAFGWYAGIVGAYYTLMGWGKREKLYELPQPTLVTSIDDLIKNIKAANIKNIKIAITGNGRVSQGAQYILNNIGAVEVTPFEFKNYNNLEKIVYTVLTLQDLVAPNESKYEFDSDYFKKHPENFHQTFTQYTSSTDILLSCHFWAENQPVYINQDDFKKEEFRIKMIGDITCDIKGSIKSTLRASTHDSQFYDYNPNTETEDKPFSNSNNITVMAVDTCPNALPRETSEYFGEQLITNVLNDIFINNSIKNEILERATIIQNGTLTSHFEYLNDYVTEFLGWSKSDDDATKS